jgi:hypothetical protein
MLVPMADGSRSFQEALPLLTKLQCSGAVVGCRVIRWCIYPCFCNAVDGFGPSSLWIVHRHARERPQTDDVQLATPHINDHLQGLTTQTHVTLYAQVACVE